MGAALGGSCGVWDLQWVAVTVYGSCCVQQLRRVGLRNVGGLRCTVWAGCGAGALQCGCFTEWVNGGEREMRCVIVAMRRNCSVGKLRHGRVVVWGSYGVGQLQGNAAPANAEF